MHIPYSHLELWICYDVFFFILFFNSKQITDMYIMLYLLVHIIKGEQSNLRYDPARRPVSI